MGVDGESAEQGAALFSDLGAKAVLQYEESEFGLISTWVTVPKRSTLGHCKLLVQVGPDGETLLGRERCHGSHLHAPCLGRGVGWHGRRVRAHCAERIRRVRGPISASRAGRRTPPESRSGATAPCPW